VGEGEGEGEREREGGGGRERRVEVKREPAHQVLHLYFPVLEKG
jgi:hypothetical protein